MSMEPLGLPSIPTNRSSRMLKTSSSVVPCLAEALRAGRSRHTPRKVGDAGSGGSPYRSVRLAPSLAAALLDGIFEHSGVYGATVLSAILQQYVRQKPSFSADC